MAKQQFHAESKRLLEMMIHSIYSRREIFLRELISNASDAMDKLYYKSLTEDGVTVSRENMEIRIRIDKENRYLRIIDRGIGMNAEELEKNLGTIAHSDTGLFSKDRKDAAAGSADNSTEENLIGQFGVGFYSAFMVADRIAVLTKKYGDEQGWRWDSDGVDGFTIKPYDKKQYGTEVVLRIRQEEEEGADEFNQFLREYPLYKLVKKYSDYIRYPIRMYMPHPEIKKGSDPKNPEFEEVFSYETLNSMVPLWQRSKSEVTKEQQIEFFKEHFGESVDPRSILQADVEGSITYKALLFIPAKQPHEYGTDDYKPGVELYSANVRVLENCEELLPEEFNFIRGIVDSPDISLNISREILQRDRNLTTIRNNLGKRIRKELLRMLQQDRKEYEAFHESFGHHLKVCAMDDYGKKKDTLGELLLFYSGRQQKLVTLDEYVEAMKEDQKKIYYVNGKDPAAIDKIPQMEILRENEMDVLYFLDPADQFVAQMFGSYKEKPFCSIINGDLGLESRTDAQEKENADRYEELLGFIRKTLGERVQEVRISSRLKSHPVCLTNGSGITFEMERYFRSLSPDAPVKVKYILEINPNHPAIEVLEKTRCSDAERAAKYCEILYNQSRMIAGIPVEDPSGYTDLLCSLWQ